MRMGDVGRLGDRHAACARATGGVLIDGPTQVLPGWRRHEGHRGDELGDGLCRPGRPQRRRRGLRRCA